ncbi:uncharacterized protein CLUP02_05455 [Colletotrichum lupini]|uniref:Uncharacterized protein n=1 Tax=Colletotrichum lupini TaxID=145971 RepID=A0A9Q8WE27_9PEZI|nr:uncharacterized protein CLUP02_05455 [Colletotrichum lupini]UQC79974.1 hypothetical protein CLUP02_05455 [Colletotrichum lupini]
MGEGMRTGERASSRRSSRFSYGFKVLGLLLQSTLTSIIRQRQSAPWGAMTGVLVLRWQVSPSVTSQRGRIFAPEAIKVLTPHRTCSSRACNTAFPQRG